jgi:hypothetical protein
VILLTSTSDLVQLITAGPQVIHVHASYADLSGGGTSIAVNRENSIVSSATTTNIVPSPAASTQRNLKTLSVRNTDATTANTITLQHTDGTNVVVLQKLSLLAQYTLTWTDEAGWILTDGNGVVQSLMRGVDVSGADHGVLTNSVGNLIATIGDGTNAPAAVKPSGTAPLSTDEALVVAVSPNLPTTSQLSSAVVNASAAGNNTLVAGVGGKTIRIFQLVLTFSIGGTVTFQDGASTALSGALTMTAGGSITLDFNPNAPWYLTSSGNGFVMNLAGGAAAAGTVYYTQS